MSFSQAAVKHHMLVLAAGSCLKVSSESQPLRLPYRPMLYNLVTLLTFKISQRPHHRLAYELERYPRTVHLNACRVDGLML